MGRCGNWSKRSGRSSRNRGYSVNATPALRWGFLIVAGVVAAVQPASAKILSTKSTASSNWSPLLALTLGGGFEFETDSQESQYDFPFLIEYNFSERLKLTIEPNVSYIQAKSKDARTVTGFGDLETSVEYEFLRERRYRPALSAEALIKWPTATDPDIGNPGTDYAFGIIASKDLVFVDLDMNVIYTFVGDRHEQNTLEISLAGEMPLNNHLTIEAEVVTSFGTGGIHGQPGTIGGLGGGSSSGTEGTVGLAWRVNKFMKLEGGLVLRSDQTWQVVTAWEWSFAGED